MNGKYTAKISGKISNPNNPYETAEFEVLATTDSVESSVEDVKIMSELITKVK